MDREADVLQDRIEVTALDRRIGDPRKRIRGRENEQIERRTDPRLRRQDERTQRARQVIAECRHHRAEQRQDQHPQQHRAFVIPPYSGDLVDHRLQRMGILIDVCDREIRRDVQPCQCRERQRSECELRQRRGARDIHQRRITQTRADHRHHRLDQRQNQRQHQRIMSRLGDHFALPCTFCADGFLS